MIIHKLGVFFYQQFQSILGVLPASYNTTVNIKLW